MRVLVVNCVALAPHTRDAMTSELNTNVEALAASAYEGKLAKCATDDEE